MQNPDEGPKLKEPDVFSGKDAAKLPIFVSQCVQHFLAKPNRYQTDRARVLFASSFLRDTASSWWMPKLTEPSPIIDNWQDFVNELYTMFGNRHLQSTAQNTLLNLKMKDNALVSDYLVKFNSQAPYTGWNGTALAGAFYRGLPDRIKNGFQYIQRPQDFELLKDIALDFDQRYWERQEELGHKPVKDSGKSKAKEDDDKADNKATDENTSRKSKKKKSNSNAANTTTSTTASTTKPTNTSKSADGKTEPRGPITQAEKDRRRAEGLCLYCGEKGHQFTNCPKLANRQKTGAAATTTAAAPAAPVATPAAPAEPTATTGRAVYTFTTNRKESGNSQPTQEGN
jgi:hypothetical protein